MKNQSINPGKPYPKKESVPGTRPISRTGKPQKSPPFKGVRIEDAINVNKPIEEVYAYWRDVTNLPRFCQYLKRVEILDGNRSRWTVDGPAGQPIMWEAIIVEDRPNEMISWRSLAGSEFDNAGSVWFRPWPHGGTEVLLAFSYNPPAGPLGSLIAKLAGKDPLTLLQKQLRQFKELMETGEILAD